MLRMILFHTDHVLFDLSVCMPCICLYHLPRTSPRTRHFATGTGTYERNTVIHIRTNTVSEEHIIPEDSNNPNWSHCEYYTKFRGSTFGANSEPVNIKKHNKNQKMFALFYSGTRACIKCTNHNESSSSPTNQQCQCT